MSRRGLVRLSGGVLIAISAAACRPAPVSVPTVAPAAPTLIPAARLKVGAVLEMNSEGRSDGLSVWQGALLGVETVNADGGVLLPTGARIELELVAYDAEQQADAIGATLRRLAREDGVLATVADGRSGAGDIIHGQAEQLAVPTIVLDERRPAPGDSARWTFALGTSDVDAAMVLVQFLASHGIQRIGWVAPSTATANAVRDALVSEATRTTLRVVAEEAYPAGSEPAPDAVGRIAFAGAQAVVGWPSEVGEAAALVRAAVERARGVTLYLGPLAATPAFLARVGEGADDVRSIGPRLAMPDYLWDDDPLTAPTRQLLRTFRQRFGATPSVAAATAWDAVRLIATAISRSGADRTSLRDAIGRTEDFSGASGPITLSGGRRNGMDGRAFVVARAERGAWVLPP